MKYEQEEVNVHLQAMDNTDLLSSGLPLRGPRSAALAAQAQAVTDSGRGCSGVPHLWMTLFAPVSLSILAVSDRTDQDRDENN